MGASSSKSVSVSKQYDVFISFRGEDTRCNFLTHLVTALERNSIKPFKDYELNKGDEISNSLKKAIDDSYGSLVIFSENYASSKWCLNELLQILECRKRGHFVIPVFHNIDPSHVRKQTASYGKAFEIHEQDPKNKNKLQLWKIALTEAANIAGWNSQSRINRDESKLIQNIVDDIMKKMNHIDQPSEPSESSLVGVYEYCKDVKLLLQRSSLVGIWGMGGVGKTTIAKVVFKELFSEYDSCYFFENLREKLERCGINYICDKILSELLEGENFHNYTLKTPKFKFVGRRLSSKKVLIVLDDVSKSEQLEHLQQEFKCLGVDSRVIITTRDKHVLVSLGFHPKMIYKVKILDFEKSLQLFRLNAFDRNNLDVEFEEITEKLVYYAGGLPLALKVLGLFLRSKSKEEWESALAKLKKFPHVDIQKVLKLSYDGLDLVEQQIFLDIACLLNGEHLEHVISTLDSFESFGHIGIKSLQDKALVTIGYDKCVYMHNLLQEMGQDIVRRESIESPGRRSRLWDSMEVYDVLKNNEGSNAIKGIILNMSQIKDLPLKAETFNKMTNLRYLKFYSYNGSCKIHLPEGIESFSDKLGYFHWDQFPSHSLPSTFCAEKLVKLHMPNSHVTKLWDGLQDVKNLKEIDLSGCSQLMELPDLSNASKLGWIYLSECRNLCHIHPSILHLDSLVGLFVVNCKKLVSLRSEIHLKSLKQLNFDGCSSLKEVLLSTEHIYGLYFNGTAIEMVPSSIGLVKTLQFSDPLRKVPSKISKATSLRNLYIWDGSEFDSSGLHVLFDAFPCLIVLRLIKCVKLFQLPENISVLSSLYELDLTGSSVESLPTSIKHLSCLKRLILCGCQRLWSLPELPPSLIKLDLSGSNVESLPTKLPPSLIELDLSGSNVESLPTSIKHLSCLKHLILSDCQRLRSFLEPPPSLIKLDLSGSGVDSLPTSIKHLSCLKYLIVRDCQRLQSLPELPTSLICLVAGNCAILKMLIPSTTLEYCDFSKCVKLNQQSLNSIMAVAVFRMSRAKQIKICYPTDTISWWFSYRTKQSRICMELPPHSNLLGYVLCLIYYNDVNHVTGVRCLEDSRIEQCVYDWYNRGFNANDVYAGFVHKGYCHRILFRIYSRYTSELDPVIKEFGVRPLYALELELLELGYKSKRIPFDIEVDEQQQLPRSKIPFELVLDLNSESRKYLNTLEVEIKRSSLESQDEEETVINNSNEEFDLFTGDKLKRCRCESEGDEQQPCPAKKFKGSTLQPIPLGLELELATNSYTYLEIEGIQV